MSDTKMSVRDPFGGTYYDALNSQRNMNIEMPAAIAELIDNSFEHGGKTVNVKIDLLQDIGKERIPKHAIVVDDGKGMSPEKLADHLQIGFHDEDEHSKMKFGKFGVGAKYAFFNNCTKSEVWSKAKDGDWHKAEFDLNDEYLKRKREDTYIQIIMEAAKTGFEITSVTGAKEFMDSVEVGYPFPAIRQDPPSEFEDLWSHLEQGTFVMWSNFDRGELGFGHEELEWYFSRIYRKWIGDQYVSTGVDTEIEGLTTILTDNANKTELYYNGTKKFETTSTGVDVAGARGHLAVAHGGSAPGVSQSLEGRRACCGDGEERDERVQKRRDEHSFDFGSREDFAKRVRHVGAVFPAGKLRQRLGAIHGVRAQDREARREAGVW